MTYDGEPPCQHSEPTGRVATTDPGDPHTPGYMSVYTCTACVGKTRRWVHARTGHHNQYIPFEKAPATVPEHNSLDAILTRACEFAAAHDVHPTITPADFGIQRSPAGFTHAVHVGQDRAVVAFIDGDGNTSFGVAELDWVHVPDPDGLDEGCRHCVTGPTVRTVHLPAADVLD